LSGGPDTTPNGDNENTDPVLMYRYNKGDDITELRVSVGDNGNNVTQLWDKFVVGATDYLSGYAWVPTFSVDSGGNVRAKGSITANSTPDLAETIAAASNVGPADVVCADPSKPEAVVRCGERGAQSVLGVIADGTSSFMINARSHDVDATLNGAPLTLAGRVPVKVSLEGGAIAIGDALTVSSVPGVAMKATGPAPVVGIALAAFDGKARGERTVLCLVRAGDGRIVETVKSLAQQNRDLNAKNIELEARLARLESVMLGTH
jgi:hypothetical protein